MKEIERLERRLHWSECFHLALMTLLLAFALTLTFQSDDRNTQILLALGTVIPVQLIRVLCERIERKSLRLLTSLAVVGLSILLTWSRDRWSVYLFCCLPILISGVFLPRSKGRILLTVPSPWAVLALLAVYSYGRAVESYGVPMIANITLALTALMTLNYFIHASQYRDLHTRHDPAKPKNAPLLPPDRRADPDGDSLPAARGTLGAGAAGTDRVRTSRIRRHHRVGRGKGICQNPGWQAPPSGAV